MLYSMFGWRMIFKNYGWKSFCKDCRLPLIISLFLSVIVYVRDADIIIQLKNIINIGISIIPAMVALILTAYTILLTFITGDKFSSIKNTTNGKELIKDLNSSFAACLMVSTISLIVMIVVSSIISLEIEISVPEVVNYPTYFLLLNLLLYSVSIIFGIVIDIFNCGQTTLLDEDNNNKLSTPNKTIDINIKLSM